MDDYEQVYQLQWVEGVTINLDNLVFLLDFIIKIGKSRQMLDGACFNAEYSCICMTMEKEKGNNK